MAIFTRPGGSLSCAGGELAGPYLRMIGPLRSDRCWRATGATASLRIGTGLALPLEHDVLALAKTVATLDRLSGGRLLFGIGVGWRPEELANHGYALATPLPGPRMRGRNCGALDRGGRRSTTAAISTSTPLWTLPKP